MINDAKNNSEREERGRRKYKIPKLFLGLFCRQSNIDQLITTTFLPESSSSSSTTRTTSSSEEKEERERSEDMNDNHQKLQLIALDLLEAIDINNDHDVQRTMLGKKLCPKIDRQRERYLLLLMKKIFVLCEERGDVLLDEFAEAYAALLMKRITTTTNDDDDDNEEEEKTDDQNLINRDFTKKMFTYENKTLQTTHETFTDLCSEDSEEEYIYENLSEITLRVSRNLFAGNTGQHEWTAGFNLAELAINEPGMVYNKTVLELGSGAGLAAIAMLRSEPFRLILTDKSKESNDNLEENVRANAFTEDELVEENKNIIIARENLMDALKIDIPRRDEDLYHKQKLGAKTRTNEEEMAFVYENQKINTYVSIRELDWFASDDVLKSAADLLNPDLIVCSDVGYDPDILPGLINTIEIFLQKRSRSRNYCWMEPENAEDSFDMLFTPRPSEFAKPCMALVINAKRQERTNALFDELLKQKTDLISFDVTKFVLEEKAFISSPEVTTARTETEIKEEEEDNNNNNNNSSADQTTTKRFNVDMKEERREDVVCRLIFMSSPSSLAQTRDLIKK